MGGRVVGGEGEGVVILLMTGRADAMAAIASTIMD